MLSFHVHFSSVHIDFKTLILLFNCKMLESFTIKTDLDLSPGSGRHHKNSACYKLYTLYYIAIKVVYS